MSAARQAVFVDRDGVINRLAPDPDTGLPESPVRVEDAELLPGVSEALTRLSGAGYLLVLVTNQPAAAKAKCSLGELDEIEARIEALLAAEGVRLDRVERCLHHPEGVVPELTGLCRCRKPEPGMLERAAAALGIDLPGSGMVGDSDTDVEAGRRAGCRTVLVRHAPSGHRRAEEQLADRVAEDLAAAATLILSERGAC